jgi:hypothetical protein
MTNNYVKKYAPSLAMNEMQIQATLRFHLNQMAIILMMAIIKKTNNNKCW